MNESQCISFSKREPNGNERDYLQFFCFDKMNKEYLKSELVN